MQVSYQSPTVNMNNGGLGGLLKFSELKRNGLSNSFTTLYQGNA